MADEKFSSSKAAQSKAAQVLLGIVTGMLADGDLKDVEIQYLSTWLSENKIVATTWPGSVIHAKVRQVLASGQIDDKERDHLVTVLKSIVNVNFRETGDTSTGVAALPIDDSVELSLDGSGVCHTGKFLYGTRHAVEAATVRAGGTVLDDVVRKTDILVVGTMESLSWVTPSYGRKIEKASQMREKGHHIQIISEERWLVLAGLQERPDQSGALSSSSMD